MRLCTATHCAFIVYIYLLAASGTESMGNVIPCGQPSPARNRQLLLLRSARVPGQKTAGALILWWSMPMSPHRHASCWSWQGTADSLCAPPLPLSLSLCLSLSLSLPVPVSVCSCVSDSHPVCCDSVGSTPQCPRRRSASLRLATQSLCCLVALESGT